MRRAVSIALLSCLTASCALTALPERPPGSYAHSIDLKDRNRRDFGDLTLMGAVRWDLQREDFGGFSGLWVGNDNEVVALTDKAHWYRAKLIETDQAILYGLEFEKLGRLKGEDGKQLERPFMDSEALTRRKDGSWVISFESENRLMSFDQLNASGKTLPLPIDFTKNMDHNRGIEAFDYDYQGRMVLISEGSILSSPTIAGLVISNDDQSYNFALERSNGFNVTDLAYEQVSDRFFVLERRFSILGGFSMRLRSFSASALSENAVIEPKTHFASTSALYFDNMEGLALRREADGALYAFLISDNNFNQLQNTIIAKFLIDPTAL